MFGLGRAWCAQKLARRGLVGIQNDPALDAPLARLFAQASAKPAIVRVVDVRERQALGEEAVRGTCRAHERKTPILAQLREGDFRGDRVDRVDHEVDVAVRVKESGQVLGQDELVDRFHLGLGVDRAHHLACDVCLAPADGALPGDRLAVHVRGLHDVAIDQHKRSDTAARKGLEAVRAHTAQAEEQHLLVGKQIDAFLAEHDGQSAPAPLQRRRARDERTTVRAKG